jgi:aconitate hydratase
MAQKILAGRLRGEAALAREVEVEVDQIVLVRAPARAYLEAVAGGFKKASAEVAIAYDGRCMTDGSHDEAALALPLEMLARGILIGRAGGGFPAPVHLERFASPARLCITDEPRLAGVGGIGMLTLVVPAASLAGALVHGTVMVRPPVSVQISLGGRLRPFVCARDVALEMMRRGVADVVRRVEEARGAPVVLEFTGPSARLLSVGERAVLAGLAPQVGAAAALFVSDERTEVFLRDQRRSKAHRALAPDAGAPCEEVVNLDLGAVDPLLQDEEGKVRAVRDLVGRPVTQALLGGDGGTTLRDLFATAALLKSKRVPSRLDFLIAVPSRQMLEVLSRSGALSDLLATGARLVEPDARVVTGELYLPTRPGEAMRTCDREPCVPSRRRGIVASAESLAYAVSVGEIGDPRSFKRPVRVTVPRTLPTDDVLVARKAGRGDLAQAGRGAVREPPVAGHAWRAALTLELVEGAAYADTSPRREGSKANGHSGVAIVCATLDEVRGVCARAPEMAASVRAVMAAYIPAPLVALLSAAGIAAIRLDGGASRAIKGQRTIALPAPSQWLEGKATTISVGVARLPLTWLALGTERALATGGPLAGTVVRGPVAADRADRADRTGRSSASR